MPNKGVFFGCFFISTLVFVLNILKIKKIKFMQIDNYQNLPVPNSIYEHKVIDFCKKWLGGEHEFILKTSGSTGEPKPIKLLRSQMIASAKLTGRVFNLQHGNRALVCLNIEYIAGIMMLVRGMELGLRLTIVEPSGNPLENLENQRFDFFAFVPLQLQNVLENQKYWKILNQAKVIIVGGAAVNKPLKDKIKQLEVPIYSTYGMTETVSHIAIKKLNDNNSKEGFQVLEGVNIGIDDRNCLNITAEASNNQLIQTNDIVEIINEKEFKLIGRFDNIINSGGVKIQLEKVEKIIENEVRLLGSKRYFAYGIPNEKLGQKLVLVIEGEEMDSAIKELFFQNVKSLLAKYEIPKQIYYIERFIETQTGKVDKKLIIKAVQP
jgi:O-succinylbenzoic acid--CoA ligase